MASIRSVSTDFWIDAEEWTAQEKLVFLYLITCPTANICGFFKCSTASIAMGTSLSQEQVKDSLARLDAHGRIAYQQQLVFVTNYSKYQVGSTLFNFHEHVRRVYKEIYKTGNRAAEMFYKRFEELINRKPLPKKKKSAQSESDSEPLQQPSNSLDTALEEPSKVLSVRAEVKVLAKQSDEGQGEEATGDEFQDIVNLLASYRPDDAIPKVKHGEKQNLRKLHVGYGRDKLRSAIEAAAKKGWFVTIEQIEKALKGPLPDSGPQFTNAKGIAEQQRPVKWPKREEAPVQVTPPGEAKKIMLDELAKLKKIPE